MNIRKIAGKYLMRKQGAVVGVPTPRTDGGVLTARHFYEDLARRFRDHIWVFFDLETTGLPVQMEGIQITQLSAVAVEMGDFETGEDGFTPIKHGEYHGTAHLSDMTFRNLRTPRGDKVFTIEQILGLNRYDLKGEYARRGLTPPSDLAESPLKGMDDSNFDHHGPAVNVEVDGSGGEHAEEAQIVAGLEKFIARLKSGGKTVTLFAHNAGFDHDIFVARAEALDVHIPAFESCDVIDTQEMMKIYFEPVAKAMSDRTVHDRFQEIFNKRDDKARGKNPNFKPSTGGNRWALDDVNRVLGILKKGLNHTSHADVENLIKATAKALIMMRDAGDTQVHEGHMMSKKERQEFLESTEKRDSTGRKVFLDSWKPV